MHNRIRLAALAILGVAQAAGQSGLADASLEQLLNTQVTSVAKTEQDLAHTAAAVFVIGQEDIRRSGASNIPDLLRMVPGVNVAQITTSSWAISIRGFNQFYSDKVLVMVDGRSVYAPSFGGVYWDQVDMPLEMIDRIEVIRGPAASVWGANAMNGVINIITKNPKTNKGGTVTAKGDSEYGTSVDAQYSGSMGSSGAYRAFGRYLRNPAGALASGEDGFDGWSRGVGGLRSDWDITPNDSLTTEGSIFLNREDQYLNQWYIPLPGDVPFRFKSNADGADLLTRWTHTFANGSSTTLQAYYDEFHRSSAAIPETARTFDIDFQHHLRVARRHDIVWGLGFRSQTAEQTSSSMYTLSAALKTDRILSAFVEDQIQLSPHVWVTVGAKLEHNSYSGGAVLPSARIAWTPDSKQTFWASAAKGIREPARAETSVSAILEQYSPFPGIQQVSTLSGNPHQQPERLNDYEVGYRRQWSERLSLDVDSFLSFYRDLSSFEFQPTVIAPGPVLEVLTPIVYGNGGRAVDYGGEASLTWRPNSRIRIAPGYSMAAINFKNNPLSGDTFSPYLAGNTPRHTFQVRTWVNLTRRLEFDPTVYWTEGFANASIGPHARVDVRLAWKASESVEVSLTGQNLLRPDFMEFGDIRSVIGTASPRVLNGKITWRF
ncbi:MAG TPA: TonB-dependent receptor [Bryobacteraceae bacterium]|jgi:iron complex outermembrane receptor protein|nr:TonB-dependent receptor [Bryobacteraceae bacterium]